jgi:hypothetical protein
MAVSGHCEFKNLHAIFGYKVMPVSVAIKGKAPTYITEKEENYRKMWINWRELIWL